MSVVWPVGWAVKRWWGKGRMAVPGRQGHRRTCTAHTVSIQYGTQELTTAVLPLLRTDCRHPLLLAVTTSLTRSPIGPTRAAGDDHRPADRQMGLRLGVALAGGKLVAPHHRHGRASSQGGP